MVRLSEIQSAAFLTALAVKGESAEEITGFVKAMRSVCIEITTDLSDPLVDTCGTGGDRFKTFNVSTTSAIICRIIWVLQLQNMVTGA